MDEIQPSQPPVKKPNKVITVVIVIVAFGVGFVAGMEYKAYEVRTMIVESLSSLTQPDIASPFTPEPILGDVDLAGENSTVVEKNIGDEVDLATIKLKVTNVEEKNTLTAEYSQPTVAKEGVMFIVIDIQVTNITNEPFQFNSNGLYIKDSRDRTYNEYAEVFMAIDDYIQYKDLAPGIMEQGKLVYEVPEDAESYSLNVFKGGTKEEYRISLR